MLDLPTASGIAAIITALKLPPEEVKSALQFAGQIIGEPVRVATTMLADQVYWWQWRNRVRILEKARQLLVDHPTARIAPPPHFVLPLLEASGNCDDSDLQGAWAQLLCSATINEVNAVPAFIEVLKRLTPIAAQRFEDVARLCLVEDATPAPDEYVNVSPRLDPDLALLESCSLVHYTAIVDSGLRTMRSSSHHLDFGPTVFGMMFFASMHGLDPREFGSAWGVGFSGEDRTIQPFQ